MYRWICAWACCALLSLPVRAQQAPPPADSLKSYDLAEIVVSEGTTQQAQVAAVHRVALAEIVRQDAAAVADIARLIPAAHTQTNSRGETLVYLRNAGERQVALFFDGALLNVPWDNRIDLSFVPTQVVGGMTVAKGVPSVLYGANVLGGAINLTSRALESGTTTEVGALAGTHDARRGYAAHLGRRGAWSYALAGGYQATDGSALPDEPGQTLHQPSDDLRLNTDQLIANAFARLARDWESGARVGLSVLHIGGEKGVAPEEHEAEPRLWRYPDWQNSMAILNGSVPLGGGRSLRGAAWAGRFEQTIHEFDSLAYDRIVERQMDDDLTLGTRLIATQQTTGGALRLSLNALTSGHESRTEARGDDGFASAPALRFRQHLASLGAEYAFAPADALQLTLGASLDAAATPETGDKPARDAFVDWGATAGAAFVLSPHWTTRAALGRKTRFPTLRELFDGALGRFLVNPDLTPESSLLGEVGIAYAGSRAAGEVVVFANRTFDTIDQRRVGEERLRQRYNREGSRVVGVEVAGRVEPLPRLGLDGHVTVSRPRGLLEEGGTEPLVEKPAVLATLTASYTTRFGLALVAQAEHTGRAYSLGADGLVALPRATAFDARVAYRRFFPRIGLLGEIFVRVDNATDTLVLPQLGLPAAGREIRLGLNLTV